MFINKTIWIIDQYALTASTGMGGGGRHYYLARELAKLGCKVYVFASSYNHLLRKPPKFKTLYKIEEIEGFNFVWLKVPKYKHAHDKRRVLNWFLFAYRMLKVGGEISDKPSVIIASSPSPFVFLPAKKLSKLYGAKLIFEVRDIWPLTLKKIGKFTDNNPLIRLMQWVEDKAYKESDIVLSNLPYAVDHMKERGMDSNKFKWIPNGICMEEFNNTVPLNKDASNKINRKKFIVGYAGTLGVANSLDYFIDSARELKDSEDIMFVLIGDGKEKQRLIKKSKGLTNVLFIDSIPKKEMQSALSLFDVCFIGWNNEELYKYGIAANKIPEYMLAGKPIVHSFSGQGDSIKNAHAGVTVEAERSDLISDAILEVYRLSEEDRRKLGENGKSFALKNYDYKELAKRLSELF